MYTIRSYFCQGRSAAFPVRIIIYCKIISIFCNIYFSVPGQPISITVLQGTNYSDITVVPPKGSVDFYTLLSSSYCLLSDIIKSSYILETIPNKKDTLRLRTEPGVCCMILVVAVSNNITSAPLNSTIKTPESG